MTPRPRALIRTSSPKTGRDEDWPVVIGRLGKPHGVRGWLRMYSLTTEEANIFQYQPWMVELDSVLTTLTLEDWHQAQDYYLVKFTNYSNRNHVKNLVNCELYTWRSQFPALEGNEYYWADLQGLAVYNRQGQYLGYIDHLFATGANDVMVVYYGRNRTLIPYIDPIIIQVDLAHSQLIVDWEA